ncbi:hypothetical protein MMC18_001490 [Xylographa bjoerkii]|nr:hypothetical protein [Xylographa bjoerkii]
MEAFLITAVQTVFGDRIAQKYTNHLNAKWYADHNHRLEKALLSCQKLRDLARQTVDNASSPEETCANTSTGDGCLDGGVFGNAATGATIRATAASGGATPGKNGSGDVSPVSDFPALTRSPTLESSCTVPPTPVGLHLVADYPSIPKPSPRFPRQISDREPISYTVKDILSRSAELESGTITKIEEKIDLSGGVAWAGYGRKIRYLRRKSASECPLSSDQQQYEVVEKSLEGNYPVHPSEMIGEGSFRISRCANVDEALQELKHRFGPHIETILQMTIRLLGKDAKVRGHDFTYLDLYCMLYEQPTKTPKPTFVIKTLDDGVVVQEGFPTKPLSLTVYPKEVLCPTGDQIYRAGKISSSAKVDDLADAKSAVGNSGTKEIARTNCSTNALNNVTKRVRFADKEKSTATRYPIARPLKSRQRVRFAGDPEDKIPIGLKSSSLSPKTTAAVVNKDGTLTFIQQAQILGSSKQKMDQSNSTDYDLLSRPFRRPLKAGILESSEQMMDQKNGAEHDLISHPSRPPLHARALEPSEQNMDQNSSAHHCSISRSLRRQLAENNPLSRPSRRPLNTRIPESSEQKIDVEDSADQGLFSRPLRRPLGHPLGQRASRIPSTTIVPEQHVDHEFGHPLSRQTSRFFSNPTVPEQHVDLEFGHPLSRQVSRILATPVFPVKHVYHESGHLEQRASRITSTPVVLEKHVNHEHSITTSEGTVGIPASGHPIAIKKHLPEHSSWDYKETITEPELPEPEIANNNPIRLKRRSTNKNMGLSCDLANTFDTPSLYSKKHPLSFRNRHAPRVGSPLYKVSNYQEQYSDIEESGEDIVPDFVDRSGGSPVLDTAMHIPDLPLPPMRSTKPHDNKEEVAGGIALAIAVRKNHNVVRIPGSTETVTSNACESF